MATLYSPKIVTDGLILCLDASNPKSYPGTGTTWYDLSGRDAHGTLNGTVTYNSLGYMNFATMSDSNYISSTVSQYYVDMTMVMYPDFSYFAPSFGIIGLIATTAPSSNGDKSLRVNSPGAGNAWNFTNKNPDDTNGWANGATTYYINGVAGPSTFSNGWNVFGGYRTNQSAFPANFSYFLGSGGYGGRGYQGKIAAVYMYNRQLTAADHLQNYNATKARFGL